MAVLLFPAVSTATPSATRSNSFPGVLTSKPELVAENVYAAPEPESVGPIVQEVEFESLVISLINKPVTLSENVALTV